MFIGKTVPSGTVKSSSMLPFHFPDNPTDEFWYEDRNAVTNVKNVPFAASLICTPFPRGVPISNEPFKDKVMPLSLVVASSPGLKSLPFTRIIKPPEKNI